MASKLTKKQQLIYDFIKEYTVEHNFSPSYREIAAGLGLSSVASVAEHVDHLVTAGALRRAPGAARSLEVVDTSYPETTELFRFHLATATAEQAEVLKAAAAILGVDLESQ